MGRTPTTVLFIWIIWPFLLFRVVFDVFRSLDLRGLAKAAWLVFVIALPYLGVFVDIIARRDGTHHGSQLDRYWSD